MLTQRVLTALVLLPLLLAAVWWLPTPALYGLFAVVGLLIAWEWTALMGLARRLQRFGDLALTALLLAGTWVLRDAWIWFTAASLAWWVYAFMLVRGYPENFARARPGGLQMALIGQLLILPTVLALALLHEQGLLRLLYVFFLIFAADTGAYFAGRRFGKRKLAPSVSPGKSVEGAIGGLLLCAVWALTAGSYIFEARGSRLLVLALLSLAVAAVSVLGDLSESMFKRAAGVKDSGSILPGHGGVLDRTDSLLAAAPLMVLGVGLLGF